MVKMIKTRIGRSTAGRPLELDIDMQKIHVDAALESYTLDEQIDMLCVLEFTIRKRLVADLPSSLDEECLEVTFEYLDNRRQEKAFLDRLDQLGLRTSIDRLRDGQARAL